MPLALSFACAGKTSNSDGHLGKGLLISLTRQVMQVRVEGGFGLKPIAILSEKIPGPVRLAAQGQFWIWSEFPEHIKSVLRKEPHTKPTDAVFSVY